MAVAGPADAQPEPRRGPGPRRRWRQFAWASVPVWSLTLLAFAPFLRLAVARRRTRDWLVFAGYLMAVILELVLLSTPADSAGPVIGTVMAALLLGSAPVHAFIAFRPVAGLGDDNREAVAGARARLHRRSKARELARSDPALARELRIGRPDLPREYDDGGVIDINHVPAEVMASGLGLAPEEVAAVLEAREALGRFAGPDELSAYAELAPDRVDALRDWLLFG
jgi:hypothetical protein